MPIFLRSVSSIMRLIFINRKGYLLYSLITKSYSEDGYNLSDGCTIP